MYCNTVTGVLCFPAGVIIAQVEVAALPAVTAVSDDFQQVTT